MLVTSLDYINPIDDPFILGLHVLNQALCASYHNLLLVFFYNFEKLQDFLLVGGQLETQVTADEGGNKNDQGWGDSKDLVDQDAIMDFKVDGWVESWD